jgi:condensin-2 complex subunit D3
MKCQAVRRAVVAMPKYLSVKAPEKTDARAITVEAILMVVKALGSREQREFSKFVAKLSRGKPRFRLMAVDLAVALLGGLPDPLGLNREDLDEDDHCSMEERFKDADCDASQEQDGDAEDEVDKEAQEGDRNTAAEEAQSSCQKGQGSAQVDSNAETGKENMQTADNLWWGVRCLEALLHRCSDKVPAIRARALTNMAQALELLSADLRHRLRLQALMGFRVATTKTVHELNAQPSNINECFTPEQETPSLGGQTPSPESDADGPGPTPITPGASHRDLGFLLRRRCMDDKAAVRKAALILMTKSTALLGKPPDDTMLQAMGASCSDPMVSIKKAALLALSEVLKNFPTQKVISEWLQSVPPLVMDNESSIQEECLNLFQVLVLDRISSVAAQNASGRRLKFSDMSSSQGPEQEMDTLFPQGVLPLLKGISDGNVASCVKRICTMLGKKGRLKAGIALALQNIITTSESVSLKYSVPLEKWTAPPGAWMLLSEVSAFTPKAVGWKFLCHHWQLLDKTDQNNEVPQGTPYNTPVKQGMDNNFKETEAMSVGWAADRVFLLQTISNVAVELSPDAAAELAHDLLQRLEAFNMHPTEVGAHVKALITLCKRQAATSEEGTHIIAVWVDQLLAKSEEILDEYISQFSNADKNDSFKTPQPTSKTRSRTKKKGKSKSSDFSSLSIQVVTAIFTVGALVLVCPTAKLGRLVTLLQAMVTSKGSSAGGEKHGRISLLPKQVAPAVYTQAWVTLGKICLADDKLAKSCIPLFVQELEITDSPAVRNNIMVAMTDFCVRYTALVDGCIAKLTKSLRDSCELVRRQAFILLARLLQRDYVKWKGMLFHRFLLALVDESEKIRQLADFLFGSILKTKAPLLAYNSFVEAIFILNDCHVHASHIEALQTSESERHLFSLRGNNEAVCLKRMHIYVSLLKQMQPEHLLATSAKLCAEILASAADGLLDLDDFASQCVLQDALQILACKEIRIQGNRAAGGVAENMELEEESGAAAFAASKGRVVTQIAKKNLVQNAIPIFIELKRLLESKNSHLTGCLMDCLRMILKEYKSEIDEILVADKQLQKELLYDIQKYEAMKTKSKVAEAVVTVQDSATLNVPSKKNDNLGSNLPTTSQNNGSVRSERPPKTPASVNRVRKGSNGDKENADIHDAHNTVRPSAMKRKTFLSPGVEKSLAGKVKWLDQASGHNLRTPEVPMKTPRVASSRGQAGCTSNALRSAKGTVLSPNNIPVSRRHKIASAVADVAAAQTVSAVLREVATGSSTPLHSMSIPRLKPSVPSTMKARAGSAENSTGLAGLLDSEGQEGLQSIRRRQTFNDIDD